MESIHVQTETEVLGEASEKEHNNEKESWWWNDEVTRTVKLKTAFKRHHAKSRERESNSGSD